MDTLDAICREFGCTLPDLYEYIPDEEMTKADHEAVAVRKVAVSHHSNLRKRSSKTEDDE